MKKRSIFFAIFFIFVFLFPADGALIVNHTAVMEFNQYQNDPVFQSYILLSKQMFNISYGHSSHGSQIISGMNWIRDNINNSLFGFTSCLNSWGSTCPPPANQFFWTRVGHMADAVDLGNPDYTRWVQATTDHLDSEGVARNLIIWSWCGQASYNNNNVSLTYLPNADQIESDYPDMGFIYMTGHTIGCAPGECPAYELIHQNNQKIRDYAIQHNKILYDFADIESWDPAGNYYPAADDDCDWCESWCNSHPQDCVNLPGAAGGSSYIGCAHSPDAAAEGTNRSFNCVLKGKAFWWMMAKLAGWNASNSSSPPPDKLSFDELIVEIQRWQRGDITIEQVISAMERWKAGN